LASISLSVLRKYQRPASVYDTELIKNQKPY